MEFWDFWGKLKLLINFFFLGLFFVFFESLFIFFFENDIVDFFFSLLFEDFNIVFVVVLKIFVVIGFLTFDIGFDFRLKFRIFLSIWFRFCLRF